MMYRRMWRMALLGILFLPGATWAQYRQGDVSVSLLVGPDFFDIAGVFEDRGIDRANQHSFNLRIEYTPVRWVGLEIAGTLADGDIDTFRYIGYEWATWYFSGNAVFHLLPDQKFVPYVTAGGGIVIVHPQAGDNVSKFAWNVGGGLDIFLSERWAIRVDARMHSYKIEAADLSDITIRDTGLPLDFGGTLNDFIAVFGVRFKF